MTRAVYHYILRTFAQTGKPPSVDAIVQALSLPDAATGDRYLNAIEAGGGIYRDPTTRQLVSAYPFSAVSSAHRVTLNGTQAVYAMCAMDALGMPFMLDTDAIIQSNCGHCGQALTIHIANSAISSISPQAIVVVYASAPANCCAATDQCPYINFFCNPDHAHAWQTDQPRLDSKLLTLTEALALGRATFEHLLRPVE
jgi:hypothetical protein